ncbi:MAG: SCO family protein [bacterium]
MRPALRLVAAAILACASVAGVPPVAAQVNDDLPELAGIGIDEKLNAQIPLDLSFKDETGAPVTLRQFFRPGHPVLLSLVYFNCPMLCNVFLDGLTDGLRGLDWTPGRQFEVVSVSIDPKDDPAGATRKRAHFIESLGRPEAATGWHFLTGDEASIRKLADVVGFKYRWLADRGQFVHSAGLFVSTPEGRLSRLITGVLFDPQTLRLALVEASHGKIGSPVDHFLLFCYAYDHTAGRYGPTAFKIMRLGGALTVAVLALFLLWIWRRDVHRHRVAGLGASS